MQARNGSILVLALVILLGAALLLGERTSNNAYGKPERDLHPATRALLKDPSYRNVITPQQFDRQLAERRSFFVYYFAPDCPHCRYTTPLLIPLASQLGIRLQLFNLIEFPDYYRIANIAETPTLVYYRNGIEADRLQGGLAGPGEDGWREDDFRAFFDKHRAAASG